MGPDYANAPDAELISTGSADAFAVVDDRHAAAVYRWARSRVVEHAGRPDCDDVRLRLALWRLVPRPSRGLRVSSSTTYNGVDAYRLTAHGAGDTLLNGNAYVAQSDHRPLELDSTNNGGEKIVVTAYEYLPDTPANRALLDVATAHPGAQVEQAPTAQPTRAPAKPR